VHLSDVLTKAMTLSEEAQRRFTICLHEGVDRWSKRNIREPPLVRKRKRHRPQAQRREQLLQCPRARATASTQDSAEGNEAAASGGSSDVEGSHARPAAPPLVLPPPLTAEALPALIPNKPPGLPKRKRVGDRVMAATAMREVQQSLMRAAAAWTELKDDPWRLTTSASGQPVFARAAFPAGVEWAEVADPADVEKAENSVGDSMLLSYYVHASTPTQRAYSTGGALSVPLEQALACGLHLLAAGQQPEQPKLAPLRPRRRPRRRPRASE
jgi:hypothetical protein